MNKNRTIAKQVGKIMGTGSRSLQDTPTWALATVCFVIISISIFIEHFIHLGCNWLKRHRQTSLFEAVQKLKSVLILLGLMSLLLTVIQRPVARICIPTQIAYSMLPCRKRVAAKTIKALALAAEHMSLSTPQNSLPFKDSFKDQIGAERKPAAVHNSISEVDHCQSQGKTSLISEKGINQLSIFIFVLAVMQIVYCVLTMALGRAKMRRWKSWEKETRTVEYQVANDPNRFRFTRQTTFGRRHTSSCTHTSLQLWVKCFFRQFFQSVAKVDYLTLRHGFISAHLSSNYNSFDFQKYITRSLEHDFKVVVGIRPYMWFVVVIFVLLDVHGWQLYLWLSFLPLALVLVLGTKMEMIVAQMALQHENQNDITKGTPLVQPNDDFFWFGRPKHVLTLIHFTLFLNAFEVAFFIWVTSQFGIKSCYHEHIQLIITRVILAVAVQVLCSYITLPLYALVTQMGSQFRRSSVLEERTANVIKQWHAEVRKKVQKQKNPLHRSQSERTYDLSAMSGSKRSMDSPHSTSRLIYRQPTLADMVDNITSQLQVEENSPKVDQVQPNLAIHSSPVQEIEEDKSTILGT